MYTPWNDGQYKTELHIPAEISERDESSLHQAHSPGGGKISRKMARKEMAKEVTLRRNARERDRVKSINDAFELLRDRLPMRNLSKKPSKFETLQTAIEYITRLHDTLKISGNSLGGFLPEIHSPQNAEFRQSQPIHSPESGFSSTDSISVGEPIRNHSPKVNLMNDNLLSSTPRDLEHPQDFAPASQRAMYDVKIEQIPDYDTYQQTYQQHYYRYQSSIVYSEDN
jgi:hypothetical protein